MYKDFVSTEPLDTVRANECETDLSSLTTRRFRAFWNEIERLRFLAAPSLPADSTREQQMAWAHGQLANHNHAMRCPNCDCRYMFAGADPLDGEIASFSCQCGCRLGVPKSAILLCGWRDAEASDYDSCSKPRT